MFYWETMNHNIHQYVQSCIVCWKTKPCRHCVYSTVTSLFISMRQFSEISMNFITNLSLNALDDHVYDAVLVVIDWYTKVMKYLLIIKFVNICGLADFTYHYIFLMFDWSEGIVSDWDSVFISAYWSAVFEHIKVKRCLSIIFHSQMNGQMEKQNSTFEQYLRCF